MWTAYDKYENCIQQFRCIWGSQYIYYAAKCLHHNSGNGECNVELGSSKDQCHIEWSVWTVKSNYAESTEWFYSKQRQHWLFSYVGTIASIYRHQIKMVYTAEKILTTCWYVLTYSLLIDLQSIIIHYKINGRMLAAKIFVSTFPNSFGYIPNKSHKI